MSDEQSIWRIVDFLQNQFHHQSDPQTFWIEHQLHRTGTKVQYSILCTIDNYKESRRLVFQILKGIMPSGLRLHCKTARKANSLLAVPPMRVLCVKVARAQNHSIFYYREACQTPVYIFHSKFTNKSVNSSVAEEYGATSASCFSCNSDPLIMISFQSSLVFCCL